ncbi:MAG: M20/M25/M40 family metallo-hydrolase [Pirellulaceae bacterium]
MRALPPTVVASTLSFCLTLLLLLAPPAVRAAEHAALLRALESIQAEQLQRHVDVLADDTFEGREAGSRGGRAAAGYLVGELQRLGLQPAGLDGGFFQPFGNGYRNILARLEGRDPSARDQVILIGAHYDHVGYGTARNSYGPTGYIHNGADDNASGVAGLLELIEAFTSLPQAPRHSVLFAFWDGEEKGLLGSKHWAAAPTVPMHQVALAVNMDMIGRLTGQKVEVHGSRTGFGIRQLVSRANEGHNLRLDFVWKMEENSDHYSFYERQRPVLMLHTGLHGDYHRPSDDAHKLNKEGMQQVARLLFNITYQLAESEDITKFRSASHTESTATQQAMETQLAAPAPRLGVVWLVNELSGFEVTQVVDGSPAATAGIRTGDRLLAFNNQPLDDEQRFRIDVLAAPADCSLLVQSVGEAEPRTVDVRLQGRPTRLGIGWNEDDAEPGSVILTRVVPGSAAAVAGLQPGDRIYEINEQRFQDSSRFKELAITLPGPLNILAERDGQIRRLTLPVPEAALTETATSETTAPQADVDDTRDATSATE